MYTAADLGHLKCMCVFCVEFLLLRHKTSNGFMALNL